MQKLMPKGGKGKGKMVMSKKFVDRVLAVWWEKDEEFWALVK